MNDRPIDLRPLDPCVDPAAEDVFVERVMASIAARSERLRPGDVLAAAWSLASPTLLAASLVLGAALYRAARPPSTPRPPATIAEAIGVPPPFLSLAAATRRSDTAR